MNVFYFSSNQFVSVAATSIISLMENNKSSDSIHFYIIDDGIDVANKMKLIDMIKKYKREVDFISAPEPSEMFRFSFKSRYQMGHSYMRMCVGRLLPDTVEKVLCLDSDTLILGDLTELWNLDMGGKILAGVADCMNLNVYEKQFNLCGNEFYCNAGMFLVDLKKWREKEIEEEIIKVIQKKNGNVFFFEQTLMNYSCRGNIYRLHPKYNCYTLLYAFEFKNLLRWRNPTVFYTEEEVKEANENPCIIHFTRNFYMLSRPWVCVCDHPMTNAYLKYKNLTDWTKLDEDNRSKKEKIKYKIWHIIPQSVLSVLAGFVYNSVRPKLWWKNE